MKAKRVETPAVRRDQILSSARAVLVEKGYPDTSLDDIAERAGVAKGTLYLYYSNKQDLIAAVMDSLIGDLDRRLKAATKGSPSPESRLESAVGEMLAFFDDNKDVIMIWQQAKPQLGEKVLARIRARLKELLDLIGTILAPAVASGHLRAHDPKTGAWFLISLSRMFMMRSVLEGRKNPLRAEAPALLDLFLNGLGGGSR